MTPKLSKITPHKGIAGQISYDVTVTYPDETPEELTFVGSIYGGPVVMITPSNPGGTFVTEPGRFGSFGIAWIERFFA